MALENPVVKTIYDGTDDTIVFPIECDYFNDTEIRVVYKPLVGANVPLVKDADFEIPGEGEENEGDVVLIGDWVDTPPATGTKILVGRETPLTQLVALLSDISVPALMEALDRAVMKLQELQEQLDRATLADEFTEE